MNGSPRGGAPEIRSRSGILRRQLNSVWSFFVLLRSFTSPQRLRQHRITLHQPSGSLCIFLNCKNPQLSFLEEGHDESPPSPPPRGVNYLRNTNETQNKPRRRQQQSFCSLLRPSIVFALIFSLVVRRYGSASDGTGK